MYGHNLISGLTPRFRFYQAITYISPLQLLPANLYSQVLQPAHLHLQLFITYVFIVLSRSISHSPLSIIKLLLLLNHLKCSCSYIFAFSDHSIQLSAESQ